MSGARIGTAGWAIPAALRDQFPATGTGLERYAARFNAVEINSSFYRPHRAETYARWAAAVPADFAFSVKLPKTISHVARLIASEGPLAAFADSVAGLGGKLGVILVQLPPSLALDVAVAARFFALLRRVAPDVAVACEPRHASWFTAAAERLFVDAQITRVVADPAILPFAVQSVGLSNFRYRRLHGSPTMYRSSYNNHILGEIATEIKAAPAGIRDWILFDNTASGAATANALMLQTFLAGSLE